MPRNSQSETVLTFQCLSKSAEDHRDATAFWGKFLDSKTGGRITIFYYGGFHLDSKMGPGRVVFWSRRACQDGFRQQVTQ